VATKRDEQAADYRAEAIASPFAESAERSSTVSETGEVQSGMRTERVTLEIAHWGEYPAARWDFSYCLRPLYALESVRVVEEDREAVERDSREEGYRILELEWLTAREERDAAIRERQKLEDRLSRVLKSSDSMWSQILVVGAERDTLRARVDELEAAAKLAPHANADDEANHAAQAASGGGEQLQEQVAAIVHESMRFEREKNTPRWKAGNSFAEDRARQAAAEIVELTQAASGGGEGEPVANVTFHLDDSAERARYVGMTVKPLRRSQPRGWLSGDERLALDAARTIIDGGGRTNIGATIDALLARSSPPEVVLPRVYCHGGDGEQLVDIKDVRAAIAKAGVAVKEVGK